MMGAFDPESGGDVDMTDTNESAPFADRSAVLFDFDGTLADTGPFIMRCAHEALLRCGYAQEAEADLRCLIGPPLFNGFADLCHVSLEEGERITGVYREIFDAAASPDDYPLFPGMLEILTQLRAQGRKIAVATSRLQETVDYMIASLDLPPFDAVVGRLEPGRDTKADCIRDAMAQLGVDADQSVMVGDRHHDVDGAHALGVPCIGVYTGGAAAGEHEQAGADFVAHSAADIARALGVSL